MAKKEDRDGWLAPEDEDSNKPVLEGDPELSMKMKEYGKGRLMTGDLDPNEKKED